MFPKSPRAWALFAGVGLFLAIFLVICFRPGTAARRVRQESDRLQGLRRLHGQSVAESPAVFEWPPSGNASNRVVTVHVFVKLGRLNNEFISVPPLLVGPDLLDGKTVTHLRFDPKNESQVRLAMALTLDRVQNDRDFLYRTVVLGELSTSPKVRTRVDKELKRIEAAQLLRIRTGVLQAEANNRASVAGTILFESQGHLYLQPTAGMSAAGSVTYTPYAICQALVDSQVPLP